MNEEWENCKENILPLKSGRKIETLSQNLHSSQPNQKRLESEREYFP